MSINFNGKGNPWNIAYKNNGNPNVYQVKQSDGTIVWCKPYELEINAGTGALGFRTPSIVKDTDHIVGESGTIAVESSSSSCSSKSWNYILYFADVTSPVGKVGTEVFRTDKDDAGNYCLWHKDTNSPIFWLKGTSVSYFSPTWYGNKLVVTWEQEDSKGRTRICLILGSRTSASSEIINWGVSFLVSYNILEGMTWPKIGEDSFDTDQNPTAPYFIGPDGGSIYFKRYLNHYIVLSNYQPIQVTRKSTDEPSAKSITTLNNGDFVYYGDRIEGSSKGTTVNNGFDNMFYFSDTNTFTGVGITSKSMNNTEFRFKTTLNSPSAVYWSMKETAYTNSDPTVEQTSFYAIGERLPYLGGGNEFYGTSNNMKKSVRFYGDFVVGEMKIPFDETVTNSQFPTSIIQPGILYSKTTSPNNVQTVTFTVSNTNSYPVKFIFHVDVNNSTGATRHSIIAKKSTTTIPYNFQTSTANSVKLIGYFTALGLTSSTTTSTWTSVDPMAVSQFTGAGKSLQTYDGDVHLVTVPSGNTCKFNFSANFDLHTCLVKVYSNSVSGYHFSENSVEVSGAGTYEFIFYDFDHYSDSRYWEYFAGDRYSEWQFLDHEYQYGGRFRIVVPSGTVNWDNVIIQNMM